MELNAVETRIFSKTKGTTLTSSNLATEPEYRLIKPTTPETITPESAIEILKSKPNHAELVRVLQWFLELRQNLASASSAATPTIVNHCDLKPSSPVISQIIIILVNDVLPAYWPLAKSVSKPNKQHDKLLSLLLVCLRNVPGLNALLNNLRQLLDQARDTKSARGSSGTVQRNGERLALLVQVLEGVLQGDEFLSGVWRDINVTATTSTCRSTHSTRAGGFSVSEGTQQTLSLLWNDLLSLVKGGKLVSAVAEAERAEIGLGMDGESWLGNGERYGSWLGRNVWFMAAHGGEEDVKAAARALESGLTLGYKDVVIKAAFANIVAGDERAADKSKSLVGCLNSSAQRTVLYAIIRIMDKRYLSSIDGQGKEVSDSLVGAVANLLSRIIGKVSVQKAIMIDWLVALSPEAVRQSHMAHRAVILLLSADKGGLTTALSRALELFAQELFIRHTPIFQQDVNAQILLLLVNYVFRLDKAELVKISKSSLYLNAISNHLASTSPRAHFLGMVVGTAVSELVDSKDKRMNFSSLELDREDGQWYRDLTNVQDCFGSMKDLVAASSLQKNPISKKTAAENFTTEKKPKSGGLVKGGSKIIAIEELNDISSEEDDMPTYAKPDSDPENSDDDPELMQRKKPMAPVYIRDLLGGLRDLENYDSHRLALSTASSLIRRKASFGTEVTDNMEDLANLLTGLNDKYEIDSFQRWRLQGMIALLVADPKRMGPWFAQAFYNGEYSISQRASILTTLGLGAREIAGLGKEDEAMTASSREPQFPSKQLPESLHNHYTGLPDPSSASSIALKRAGPSTTSSPTSIDILSTQLSQTLLQPLAAQAADTVTGPNALKVRTFSSRLTVHSRTPAPSSNALAKILADAFIFPLIGRWSGNNIVTNRSSSIEAAGTMTTSPFLLSHLLRTLALILHASGTSSPDLPRITSEFWHLLLSVRSLAVELPVLEAVLFALLTLLEVNIARDHRRMAEEHARELLETQAWVEGLFEVRIGGEGSEEDERVRMVAAGVLVRCREVVERWQRLLMGDLIGYV